MKQKKKRVKIIVLIVILVLLLIPLPVRMSDGGSRGWYAVLWQVTKAHEIPHKGYQDGTRVSLLLGLIPVYDDTVVEVDP